MLVRRIMDAKISHFEITKFHFHSNFIFQLSHLLYKNGKKGGTGVVKPPLRRIQSLNNHCGI